MFNIQHSTISNFFCNFSYKTLAGLEIKPSLCGSILIKLIMKQVEERYISLLTDKVCDRLFEEAEIAKFTPQEMRTERLFNALSIPMLYIIR